MKSLYIAVLAMGLAAPIPAHAYYPVSSLEAGETIIIEGNTAFSDKEATVIKTKNGKAYVRTEDGEYLWLSSDEISSFIERADRNIEQMEAVFKIGCMLFATDKSTCNEN